MGADLLAFKRAETRIALKRVEAHRFQTGKNARAHLRHYHLESCLVGFRPKPLDELLPLAGTTTQFFTFVQACFAQKRKMLKNNMKGICDEDTIAAAFELLGRHEVGLYNFNPVDP